MKGAELERNRKSLEAKAAELAGALRSRKAIAIEHTPEACEQTVLAAQRELAVVTLDRNSRLLREVTAALARMGEGVYGICETCDQPINCRRLDAVPWARRCVQCQDSIDRGPNPAMHDTDRRPLAA